MWEGHGKAVGGNGEGRSGRDTLLFLKTKMWLKAWQPQGSWGDERTLTVDICEKVFLFPGFSLRLAFDDRRSTGAFYICSIRRATLSATGLERNNAWGSLQRSW